MKRPEKTEVGMATGDSELDGSISTTTEEMAGSDSMVPVAIDAALELGVGPSAVLYLSSASALMLPVDSNLRPELRSRLNVPQNRVIRDKSHGPKHARQPVRKQGQSWIKYMLEPFQRPGQNGGRKYRPCSCK